MRQEIIDKYKLVPDILLDFYTSELFENFIIYQNDDLDYIVFRSKIDRYFNELNIPVDFILNQKLESVRAYIINEAVESISEIIKKHHFCL